MAEDFSGFWRRRNLALEAIRLIVGSSCYPEHISGVPGAVFPALSLVELGRPRRDSGIVYGKYQMDSWSLSQAEARVLQDHLETLWHPRNLSAMPTDTFIKIRFLKQLERFTGAYEEDRKLHHEISIYRVVWEEQ